MPEYTYTDPTPAASDSGYTYTDPAPQPGIMSRIGNQVGDFFSTAAHTMNPENLMSQVPTSWQDLKDKWNAETDEAKAKGQAAVNQFKQGNIGTGVSTLMNAEPFIGQPTGQAAEYLRQGDVGKAAGTLAPYALPLMKDVPAKLAEVPYTKLPGAVKAGAQAAGEAGLKTVPLSPTKLPYGLGTVARAFHVPEDAVWNVPPAVPGAVSGLIAGRFAGNRPLSGALWGGTAAQAVPMVKAGVQAFKDTMAQPEGTRAPIWQGFDTPAEKPVPTEAVPAAAPNLPSGRVPGGIQNQVVEPPASTVPTPSGPSPQLLKDITKAVGGRHEAAQRWLDDMVSRGENDPYTGAALGTRPTTTQPPPTQPAPISAPQRAIPQTTQVATPQLQEGKPTVIGAQVIPHQTVPNSVIVNHVSPADGVPASMISPTGLGKFASENGMSVDQAKAALRSDGYTPLTMGELTQGLNSIYNQLFGGGKMSKADIHAGIGQKLMADHPGLPEPSAASPEQKLWTYGDMLHTPIARSAENVRNVAYKHMTSENRAPVPSNLTNVTPFGWPPQQ